jgi:hypothetical protein
MALEISRLVALHPMAQNQILCPRGRADRVGLDKAHALDRRFQRNRMKERMRDGVNSELLKVRHKALKSTRASCFVVRVAAVDSPAAFDFDCDFNFSLRQSRASRPRPHNQRRYRLYEIFRRNLFPPPKFI